MNLPEQRSDEDLAASLKMGDASASATLAQRFAPGIYDFAVRVTLDPASAEQTTENTLNRLTSEIGTRPEGLSVQAWLYGIARDEALEGMRQRVRNPGSRDEPAPGALAPLDSRFIETNGAYPAEAAAWAWGAARGQRPRDYSILDLLLRRKITPEEVADIASLSPNGVYGVIGRLRGGFEESFTSSALYSSGRQICSDLVGLVGDAPGLGPALRREISRHAESCEACRATKEGLPAAADVFGALENVEVPDALADRLLPMMLAASPDLEAAEAAAEEAAAGEEEEAAEADDEADESATETMVAGAIAAGAGLGLASATAADDDIEDANESPVGELESESEQASLFEDVDATEELEPEAAIASEPLASSEVETMRGTPELALDEEVPEDAGDTPAVEEDLDEIDLPTEEERTALAEVQSLDEPSEDAIEDPAATVLAPVAAAESITEPDVDDYNSEEEQPAVQEGPSAETGDEEAQTIFAPRRTGGRFTAPAGATAAVASGAAVTAGAAAGGNEALQRRREAMQRSTVAGAGSGGGTPFGRGPTYDDGSNRKKIMVYVAALAATLAALYVGIAVGDSLQSGGGGGGDNVAGGLPTRAAGITEASCPGPINLNQGSKVSLIFNDAPEGHTLEPDAGIRPISPTAAVTQVSAVSQEGNSILFTANPVPNSAGRTDEYRLTATFSKGSNRQQAECTVRVVGPAATPAPATATVPAASPTSTSVPPTATSAPIIQPTAVPATQAPPTATPDLSTPTPSVPTVVPTAGGVLISPTEVPPTATTVPTATSTLTPLDP